MTRPVIFVQEECDVTNAAFEDLCDYITYHQHLYYRGDPHINDEQFDQAWDALRQRQPDHPLLQQIGSGFWDDFPKKKHVMFLGSQNKARDEDEFVRWFVKQKDGEEFIVQDKLDGISVELQYEHGTLSAAVTRGDGTVGDDITRNVLHMQHVIAQLPSEWGGAVRGEIMLAKSTFEQIYRPRGYKNTRNTAAGIARDKKGQDCHNLMIFFYDVFDPKHFWKTEQEKLVWLNGRGFRTVPTVSCYNDSSVFAYWKEREMERDNLDYDIDGLVIKCNDCDPQDPTREHPEHQIALKFAPQEKPTTILSIEWNANGATYTPVAQVEPVEISGSTVRRANLCNPNLICELGIRIGSRVMICKRGEIIPKIERVLERGHGARIKIPKYCYTCGDRLSNDGTRLYCINPDCQCQFLHRMNKWISVLGIKEWGPLLLTTLQEHNMVRTIADLYRLTVEDLEDLQLPGGHRLGKNNAVRAITNLQEKTIIALAKFIAGLDIYSINELVVQKIVDAGYHTIAQLQNAALVDLVKIKGVGSITAQALLDGLAHRRDAIAELLDFVTIEVPMILDITPTLQGKSFCFTGKLTTMARNDASEAVRRLGGTVKTAVSKGLTYLVTNEPKSDSKKNQEAQRHGTIILDEEQFRALIT